MNTSENLVMSKSVRPSKLAKAILTLKGKPLDLEEYKPFEMVYDISPPEMVIKAGRQIGKSVSLGGSIITNSVIRNFFNTIYIAPLSQQTSRFSTAYLDPFLYSTIIRKHFLDSSSKKNVFEKSLKNGSRIYLTYAESEQDADRVRGASGDQLLMDEIQDISQEAIPVLRETLSASDYGYMRYTGTAKTENNTLEYQWKRSNMLEWVVKCQHCGRHSIPIDHESCIKILTNNPDGPGCIHCGKLLDMKSGTWVAAKPLITDVVGFHMPQIIIPARTRTKKWKDLVSKATSGAYSAQKLSNEVFGLASGVGGRILSLREAMLCCNPDKKEWDQNFPRDSRNILYTTLGVDWSVSASTNSYTVISVVGYDFEGKMYLLYSQRIDGVDILDQVKRVEHLYAKYQCSAIGSDRGVGVLQGQMMKANLGDDKVNMINYVAAKDALRYDRKSNFFAADRTMNIDTVVIKAKLGRRKFETPAWSLTQNLWEDALNVYEEESATGRRLYRKDPDRCDDWLHSVVFANIAQMVIKGEFIFVDNVPPEDDVFFVNRV